MEDIDITVDQTTASENINTLLIQSLSKLQMDPIQNPIKLWNVPKPNPNFTGRKELLKEVKNRLQGSSGQKIKPVVITTCHGLGGVGKTQLVTEYIHQHQNDYEMVCWIPSDNQGSIESAFLELAQDLKIAPEKAKLDEIIQIVKNYLNQKKCLLVFDNAPNYQTVEKYLPPIGAEVLITSRYTEWLDKGIEVDVFTIEESREYIRKILGNREIDKEKIIDKLTKKLGRLPLALAQASAYIRKNKMRIEDYLALYKQRKKYLLSKETLPIGDKHEAVYITWDITLNRMNEESSCPVELLYYCAFFHNENIPVEIAKFLFDGDETKRNEAIRINEEYSMISLNEDKTCFSIHCLVQEVIRIQLQKEKKFLPYLRKSTKCLLEACPEEMDRYKTFQQLLPHLETIEKNTDGHSQELDQKADREQLERLLSYLGSTYSILGNPQQSNKTLERALVVGELHYGKNHRRVAEILSSIGGNYVLLGNLQKAIELLERALPILQEDFGRYHYTVAIALENLSLAYGDSGNLEKKKELLEFVLAIREKYYGKEHYVYAIALTNLGNAYCDLGNAQKSIEHLEQSASIFENHFGKNDFHVLPTLANLGIAYSISDNLEKGAALLEHTLPLLENHFGKNHFQVASLLVNLGAINFKQGNLNKTKECWKRALAIKEKFYGMEHPNVVNLRSNIEKISQPEVIEKVSQLKHQDQIHEQFLVENRELLEHIEQFFTRGMKLYQEFLYLSAREEYSTYITNLQKIYKTTNTSNIAVGYFNLGLTYLEKGDDYQQAFLCFNTAYDIFMGIYGEEDEHTIQAEENKKEASLLCACDLIRKERPEDAIPYFIQSGFESVDFNTVKSKISDAVRTFYKKNNTLKCIVCSEALLSFSLDDAYGVLCALGSKYFTYAFYAEEAEEDFTEKCIKKANDYFCQSLARLSRTGNNVCYANFLIKIKNIDKAIYYLEQSIVLDKSLNMELEKLIASSHNKEEKVEEEILVYTENNYDTLDSGIQEILDEYDEINLTASLWAYYLLIFAYVAMNNLEKAEKTLKEFLSAMQKKVQTRYHFSLRGIPRLHDISLLAKAYEMCKKLEEFKVCQEIEEMQDQFDDMKENTSIVIPARIFTSEEEKDNCDKTNSIIITEIETSLYKNNVLIMHGETNEDVQKIIEFSFASAKTEKEAIITREEDILFTKTMQKLEELRTGKFEKKYSPSKDTPVDMTLESTAEDVLPNPDHLKEKERLTTISKTFICTQENRASTLVSLHSFLEGIQLKTSNTPLEKKKRRMQEDKSPVAFWKNQTDKLYLGVLPNTDKQIYFNLEKVFGDGNCGITAIGTTRKEFVEALLKLSKNANAREALYEEIYQAFASGEIKPPPNNIWGTCLQAYNKAQMELDDLIRKLREVIPEAKQFEGHQTTHLIDWLKQKLQGEWVNQLMAKDLEVFQASEKLRRYCCSEEVYFYYINSFLSDERRLWVGHASALLFAEVKSISVYIWEESSNDRDKLKLKSSFVTNHPTNVIHLFYPEGALHFDLLSIVEKPVAIIQKQNENFLSNH